MFTCKLNANARIQITQHATRACGVSEWSCARGRERRGGCSSHARFRAVGQMGKNCMRGNNKRNMLAQCQRAHSDHATRIACLSLSREEKCEPRIAREPGLMEKLPPFPHPNRSVQPCHVYVQAQCQRTHSLQLTKPRINRDLGCSKLNPLCVHSLYRVHDRSGKVRLYNLRLTLLQSRTYPFAKAWRGQNVAKGLKMVKFGNLGCWCEPIAVLYKQPPHKRSPAARIEQQPSDRSR